MNICSVQNNTNFKAGLTKQIMQKEKSIRVSDVKNQLTHSPYRDWQDLYLLDFRGNKAHALACKMCAKIFVQFKKAHDYRKNMSVQKLVLPHGIYVFNENELSTTLPEELHQFFTANINHNNTFRNKMLIYRQTIMLNNFYKSFEELDVQMDENKHNNFLSSGHFLHGHIHEWIHAIQGKIIYNMAFIRSGSYEATIHNYFKQELSEQEREIVADTLGEFASAQEKNQYPEVFAEAWTKFICNSLNKDCSGFDKDPIDELKKTPKEFQTILKKVSDIKIK